MRCGKKHRNDGPAQVWKDAAPGWPARDVNGMSWWLNDKEMSFDRWLEENKLTDEEKLYFLLKYT